jgi:hypothetical protein
MSVQSERTNIITIEDPIEYQLPGINQTQVNEKIKLTFASALRSILRQDPDVILVGEIRDQETARIAMQAAQTGHLVLSTLHTNDAPSGHAPDRHRHRALRDRVGDHRRGGAAPVRRLCHQRRQPPKRTRCAPQHAEASRRIPPHRPVGRDPATGLSARLYEVMRP